jgi:ankyrin repeat protein
MSAQAPNGSPAAAPAPKDPQAEQYGRELLAELAKQSPDFDQIDWLLRRADLKLADSKGETALMKVAFFGNHALMQTLLVNGAVINQQNNAGDSAVHIIARNGSDQSMSTMLEYGGNFVTPNKAGKSAQELAEGKFSALMLSRIHARAQEQDVNFNRRKQFNEFVAKGLPLDGHTEAPARAVFRRRKKLPAPQ